MPYVHYLLHHLAVLSAFFPPDLIDLMLYPLPDSSLRASLTVVIIHNMVTLTLQIKWSQWTL